MFFIFSKTIGLLTKPFSWLVLLMLAIIFFRKPKLRKILFIAALAVLLIFTNPLLLNFTLKKWEPKPVAIDNMQVYDIGIVLGGFSHYLPSYNNIELTDAGDRLWQTVSLYQQGKIRKILISGGSTWDRGKPEADAVRDVLLSMGIPGDDVLAESGSWNTYENARNSADLIATTQPGASCLLITSALHMPRSLACFRKAGLNPDAFPAEHMARHDRVFWPEWLLPKSDGLSQWNRIINEWMGILAYKMQGYI